MPESIMGRSGRVTIPAEIRNAVKAKPGTRLVWVLRPDGRIYVLAKTGTLADLRGILKAPPGVRVSVEDMDPFR